MTSTITAEEKRRFDKARDLVEMEATYLEKCDAIAAAIRDAERDAANSKLEDASAACAGACLRAFDQGATREEAAIIVSIAARSLKSPSPPKDQGHE